ALGACVAGPPPEIATPAPVLPEEFRYAATGDDQASIESLLPNEDAGFRLLSSAAIESGPSLAEAIARVEAARAGASRAGAERLPNIGVDTSVDRRRSNPAQFGGSVPAAIQFDREQTGYSANLTARWDADIFGALKAGERAALARLDAATANAEAVRIALTSEIAASVIDWRTLEARRVALERDLAESNRLVSITSERVNAGLLAEFNTLRIQATASQSATRLAALGSERARLLGRMVLLTGLTAQQVEEALEESAEVSSLPGAPASIPSDILANRPDIRAAAAQLAASDAELAAAARKRFPRLNLSATLGLLAFNLDDLFDDESNIYNLRAGLAAPLLDFGRIQAEIDGAAANKKAAFAAYRGAVFTALADAETAYGLVAAADSEARAAKNESEELQRVAELAEVRFESGLEDSLALLEARRAADSSGERAAASLGRARRARVLLWQALGGNTYPTNRSTSQ
ncbi:MAG TPA: multidrug transporter, partial [Erythrobacter sp.]|nr:multidrug transporter [Erythrobacter sp.]